MSAITNSIVCGSTVVSRQASRDTKVRINAAAAPAAKVPAFVALSSRRSVNHTLAATRAPTTSSRSSSLSVTAEAETLDPVGNYPKIRIRLKSFETANLGKSVELIIGVAEQCAADFSGPVFLPNRIKRFCVLKSPHVNKDSREHFEIRTHKRLIDFPNPNGQLIKQLMATELPSGVQCNVSFY